ncbi:MAG: sulfite exporter TauE/SafE family protein [Lachnospiraceae bacterium]|nr:sulfite exporter TauE/SafE family protein [Lachnospiraceae bacterium]
MIKNFLVCLLAGSAAGIGTGFAGLSASTVIAPMLIAFMGYPWYESVGIGLASDVLASAFSALIYRKHDNVDLKNGVYMVVAVLVMTVAGSWFSQYMPDTEMSWVSVAGALFMGIRFIVRPVSEHHASFIRRSDKKKKLLALISGAVIGFYCGFMGVGGGLMMLFILTMILGYELKTAVGTSVFVMTFTALTGSVSHFAFGDVQNYIPSLLLCIFFTTLAALITSHFANNMDAVKTNRATGITLIALGVCMICQMILGL